MGVFRYAFKTSTGEKIVYLKPDEKERANFVDPEVISSFMNYEQIKN